VPYVFHISTAEDWARARRTGSYTTSTRGVTLAEEGFIHTSRTEQLAGVWQRFYADAVEPLVLLTIDTDRLGSPWREDPVGDDTYPHVYGPINISAVVRVQPLGRRGRPASLFTLALRDAGVRIALLLGAMLLAVLGAAWGRRTSSSWGELAGALVGLALGLTATALILRRRR
jgi:uncharacterized protein (DUF952 family)